jgi:curved DNA-binding protein CbpA
MTDLYKILGVRKNASAAAIRKAFRQKAADSHPDRNLDDPAAAAEYRAVVGAYRILSDPDKRRRYDATGNADAAPDNREAVLVGVLATCFQQVVGGLVQSSREPTRHDIVEEMRSVFRAKIQAAADERQKMAKGLAKLRQLLHRFNVKDGANLIDEIITNDIGVLEKQMAALEESLTPLRAALAWLKKCSFRKDGAANGAAGADGGVAAVSRLSSPAPPPIMLAAWALPTAASA